MCFIAVPIPAFAYHTETQTPYDITNVLNSNDGSITVSWQESDGLEDNQPEYYIVYIGLSETADDVSEQTTFGFTEALSWQSYTFTAQYLYDELAVDNQKIYAKVKAFHDTNGTTSDFTPVESVMYDFVYTPTSTTSSSTTSSTTTTSTTTTVPDTTTTSSTTTSSTTSSTTTTTTTTTTLPPPPPTTTTTTLAPVIVKINGEEVEYTQEELNDGTIDRDIERQANEDKWGCYVTNIALERGDCPAYNDSLKQEEEKEEVIIEIKDEEITDTKTELPDDDIVVLEVESDDEIKDIEDKVVEEIVEEEINIDVKELEEEFAIEEDVIEIPEEIKIVIEEVKEDELDKEILTDDTESETEIQEEDELVIEEEIIEKVELTEEEIQEEVKEVEEKIEAIQETNVEELETEQVMEIIEEVNDAGLENLAEVSEDVLKVVAEVVEQSIEKADELTVEQQEVVAEVLGFTETEDVEVLAKAVKTDKTVAKAVEEYVERAVENADVENYTLADAQTEIAFESLVAGDFSVIIDIDLDAIDLTNISNDMTQDTKEKAQEVILPTVIVNIVSFVRRFN